MKDYERYMNRQKVSDAGMETLLKLETQRPERPRREESRVPQWLKYVGMAACFCLMMGLFALPILQGAQQQRAAGPERVVTGELYFNELDDVPLLSGRAAEKGDTVTAMDKEALYALFGKVARWPDMGWEKYFTVSGQRRDKADGTREYALWGSDNVAGFSSKFGTRSSGVWLELTENGAFFEEEWKELTVSVINSCEVVAVSGRNEEKGMYRAAAVFQTVSENGPYGVFYAAEAPSEVYAKQLVTQMTDYLTQSGIFVEEREILSVKLSGWYVMETDGEKTWAGVPSVTFNEDGSFGVFVAYCSSHICQGDYEITDGRVTVRCPQHTYVFDIVDEETLRFVAAESSEPEHYGDDDWPHITDGAVFRRLRDGKRAVTAVSKPQVEITDLGSSLWEDRGSGTTKEGVSYELTYQANEAAAGKKLEFYLELSEEDQELLGLDGPVCIQTYCREAGECKSSKKVYGDFAYSSVSGQDIGDVTVRCVCDGEEIACKTMPWGSYMTLVWDVQQATHHPESTHHVEESHHSDSHH